MSSEPTREVHPLKAMRKDLGLTQKGLGDLLDVYSNTVGRWERGEREPEFSYAQVVRLDLELAKIGRRISDYVKAPPAGGTAGGA